MKSKPFFPKGYLILVAKTGVFATRLKQRLTFIHFMTWQMEKNHFMTYQMNILRHFTWKIENLKTIITVG